jgi:Terminase RNaseH-like domain
MEELVEESLLEEELVEELDETSSEFIEQLVLKLIVFLEEFCDVELFPYQVPIAHRLIQSIVLGDGEELTVVATRQSGKSEVLSNVIASLMVILPKLSKVYPTWLGKFEKGFWVGVFAPTEDQADTVFSRVVSKLTSDHAMDFLLDPEIDDKAASGGSRGKGKIIALKNSGSLCRMQTCNPKAKIESKTYHFVMIDEAQEADEFMISKSIKPMLAFNNGSIALTGTATRNKSYFYKMIQFNKRRDVNGRRGHRQAHFEYDWRIAAKYNDNYAKFIAKEKVRIGEDSDEFQMSYCNRWILEKGMFVTDDRLSSLYDPSMGLIKQWWRTPVVAGIDVARSNDSTVVTVVWVDWDHPDPFGFYEHRVLNWLEINNEEWESQYFEIIDFLRNYDVYRIGVDAQGVGGAVAERLQVLLPHIEVMPVTSDAKNQNDRWVHLTELMQRGQLVIPGHSKARRTRSWKRFNQQMLDLEKVYRGPYLLAEAPDEKGAFDDYPDSLAIACSLSVADTMPMVTVSDNPFFR